MMQTGPTLTTRAGPPVIGLGGMPVAVSVVVEVPHKEIPGRGFSAMRYRLDDETARFQLGFHQRQHALDDLVDVQAGGVDEDGVFGRPQWRHRALGITGVAGEDLA